MKTLILILMVTMGYGQIQEGNTIKSSDLDDLPIRDIEMLDEYTVSEWDTSEVTSLWSDNSDANIMTFYQNFTVINMLWLYQEYKAKCYNDSSLLVIVGDGWKFYSEQSIWWHNPPTFHGFMEFLKRKEKR